jgi:hypothetical protein
MKKGCLIAIASALLLIVIIILLAFGLTRGAVKAADEFLGLIGSGKIAAAYDSASSILKSQQRVGSFEQAVKNLGLTDFASSSWSSRETKNDRARLEGSVKTRSGGKIPLTMELVKESGTWKVIYISAAEAGVSTEQRGKQLPSDEKSKSPSIRCSLSTKPSRTKALPASINRFRGGGRSRLLPTNSRRYSTSSSRCISISLQSKESSQSSVRRLRLTQTEYWSWKVIIQRIQTKCTSG